MKRRLSSIGVAVAATGLTAGLLAASGTAAAAPNETSVDATIAQLQASGNRVVVNKIGNGPLSQCAVTSVRPVSTTVHRSTPQVLGANLQSITTVHVTVKC
ncbi:MAG: hypothetical protein ACM4D3_08145 [Candidatus Sericytochromatia bacterium]